MRRRGDALASPAALSDEEFASFTQFFHERTGIVFSGLKRDFVTKRIVVRMAATGCASFRSYFGQMRYGEIAGEFQELVNVLVINETYFLREAHQFDIMVDYLLPEIIARRRWSERIRIWSMPCSTGEEVYSIAITLLDRWSDLIHHDVEIEGTDISTAVLRFAQRGVYSARAVQKLSELQLHRFFISHPGKKYEVLPYIRETVRFERANILDWAEISNFSRYDIIFCRNMLIYFDLHKQAAAVANMHKLLRPGGFLFLGHSESMSRMSTAFTSRRFNDNFVYQKPEGDAVAPWTPVRKRT